MKRFFEFYSQETISDSISPHAGAKLQISDNKNIDDMGHPTLLQDGQMFTPIIFQIPWGHHCIIISKCKTTEEALFYINRVNHENWSRNTLQEAIRLNEYSRVGSAVTNFSATLPEIQGNLANEILKDPYNFDFLTLTPNYNERELETALSKNIEKFLLELGKGFAFVGRQVELSFNGKSHFIDMLFYHIKLKCYVVVELKTMAFEPEFAGKLNFYVTAVDKLLCTENENSTIGLIICKTKDNTEVEWSFDHIEKPLGVAAYEIPKLFPENFKSSLPTIEEIETSLKE